jgi:endonuclease YncB( thermonuclease family)
MRIRAIAAAMALAMWIGQSGGPPVATGAPSELAYQSGMVVKIVDGDTLDVRAGGKVSRIRLLQMDTPEVYNGPECYGKQASAALRRLTPVGAAVQLYIDTALDRVDRYGRLLRYLFRGKLNVNLKMVQDGAAAPYFYDGDRGRYASALLAAAREAKRGHRGLWGMCPGAVLDPEHGLDTGPPP